MSERIPVEQRFWKKVQVGDGCWTWMAATNGRYGHMNIGGRNVYAHHLSYQLHAGPIPPGLHVLHRCDNTLCVRPEHLFLGTHAENMHDRDAKGRARTPDHFSTEAAKLLAARRKIVDSTCAVCGDPIRGTTKKRYCGNSCAVTGLRREKRRAASAAPSGGVGGVGE